MRETDVNTQAGLGDIDVRLMFGQWGDVKWSDVSN